MKLCFSKQVVLSTIKKTLNFLEIFSELQQKFLKDLLEVKSVNKMQWTVKQQRFEGRGE